MKTILVIMIAAISSMAMAEEPRKQLYTGQLGQAPVQVMFDYLKNRIADEYGIGEYRELVIKQRAAGPENFKKVSIEAQMQGLLDDSIKTQRFQLGMSFNEETSVWLIDTVKQDWQCRRGASKGWTQKPCK
ncbi:hypothetical protein [Deefgea rivuli]|uniref:hypothetical protein n=1 Tax=Deefgea rivuli TaxID=400948 RepID=UPI00048831BB|nr:hypothetical protein [Deefgea rivuli]